jgi:hypothetical protein
MEKNNEDFSKEEIESMTRQERRWVERERKKDKNKARYMTRSGNPNELVSLSNIVDREPHLLDCLINQRGPTRFMYIGDKEVEGEQIDSIEVQGRKFRSDHNIEIINVRDHVDALGGRSEKNVNIAQNLREMGFETLESYRTLTRKDLKEAGCNPGKISEIKERVGRMLKREKEIIIEEKMEDKRDEEPNTKEIYKLCKRLAQSGEHNKLMSLLKKHGDDIYDKEGICSTAASGGNLRIVKDMISLFGVKPDSSFLQSCKSGNYELIAYFVEELNMDLTPYIGMLEGRKKIFTKIKELYRRSNIKNERLSSIEIATKSRFIEKCRNGDLEGITELAANGLSDVKKGVKIGITERNKLLVEKISGFLEKEERMELLRFCKKEDLDKYILLLRPNRRELEELYEGSEKAEEILTKYDIRSYSEEKIRIDLQKNEILLSGILDDLDRLNILEEDRIEVKNMIKTSNKRRVEDFILQTRKEEMRLMEERKRKKDVRKRLEAERRERRDGIKVEKEQKIILLELIDAIKKGDYKTFCRIKNKIFINRSSILKALCKYDRRDMLDQFCRESDLRENWMISHCIRSGAISCMEYLIGRGVRVIKEDLILCENMNQMSIHRLLKDKVE